MQKISVRIGIQCDIIDLLNHREVSEKKEHKSHKFSVACQVLKHR